MIAEAFMRDVAAGTSGEVTTAVPLPSVFPEAGYYPTSYTTRYVGSADAYASRSTTSSGSTPTRPETGAVEVASPDRSHPSASCIPRAMT